jgi:hypothetical protein
MFSHILFFALTIAFGCAITFDDITYANNLGEMLRIRVSRLSPRVEGVHNISYDEINYFWTKPVLKMSVETMNNFTNNLTWCHTEPCNIEFYCKLYKPYLSIMANFNMLLNRYDDYAYSLADLRAISHIRFLIMAHIGEIEAYKKRTSHEIMCPNIVNVF